MSPVRIQKSWYFNLHPARVQSSGHCDEDAAALSLTLPEHAASLQFSFRKERDLSYVSQLTAQVSPVPVCQGCTNETYSGMLGRDRLFAAACGRSFKCTSENLLLMSSKLRLKLVPLQVQAFVVPGGQYGQEVECSADLQRRVIPLVLGAVAVGVVLVAVLVFLLNKEHQGYERI
ncbi:lysosome-associated membrane glycoprotein 3 [Aulostomus maculatus]